MNREFKLNTRGFMEAAARFMAHSKRDALTVMKQQAKGIIKEVIAITPPGGPNVSSGQARARGLRNLKADVAKVVQGVRADKAQQSDVASVVEPKRVRGRIHSEVVPRILVPIDRLRAYLKAKQQHIGKLASGWNEAAARLGYKPPAWIWRNQGPGSIDIAVTDKDITIRATNAVPYASDISKLRSRLQQALHMQRNKLERQWQAFMTKTAQRAGFK